MKVPYHPEADEELDHAIEEYSEKDAQLGLDLVEAVLKAENEIFEGPLRYPIADDAPDGVDVRYRVLKRFRYRLVYLVTDGKAKIVAFAHFRQRPGYWKHRLQR